MNPHPLLLKLVAAVAGVVVGFAAVRTIIGASAREVAAPGFTEPLSQEIHAASRAAEEPQPAAQSPMEAMTALAKESDGIERDHAFYTALQRMDARELAAGSSAMLALLKELGVNYFGGLQGGSSTTPVAEAWIERWLDLDMPAALSFLNSSEVTNDLAECGALVGVVTVLARREPEWARRHVLSMEADRGREAGVFALLQETAKTAGAEGAKLLESFSSGADRADALTGFIHGKVEVDSRAAFAVAAAEPPGPLRNYLLEIIARGAGENGIASVRELLDRIDEPELRRKLAAEALGRIERNTQDDLLPWIMEESLRADISSEMGNGYDPWAHGIGRIMAKRDPTAALDWAATVDTEAGRKLLSSIALHATQSNAPALRQWLTAHAGNLPLQTIDSLNWAISSMAKRELHEFRRWSETLPAGLLQDSARLQIALNAASGGDLQSVESSYRLLAGSDTTGALAIQVTRALVEHDCAAAAEWAMSLPAGAARGAAIRKVAEAWAVSELSAAAQWIERMPAGAERDACVEEYATKAVYADPRAAVEWFELIVDRSSRQSAAEKMFLVWSLEDPVAARAWLKELSGVDDTWKVSFLKTAQ